MDRETILRNFPLIGSLAKVYGAITFILENPDVVEGYLADQDRLWQKLMEEHPIPDARREQYRSALAELGRKSACARSFRPMLINNRVVRAVLRRWPSIDIRGAPGFLPDNLPDPEVLAIAASEGRVLLSHDATTMPAHFLHFIETGESPGLILVPQHWPVPLIADGIYALWSRVGAEEFRNHIEWMPRLPSV